MIQMTNMTNMTTQDIDRDIAADRELTEAWTSITRSLVRTICEEYNSRCLYGALEESYRRQVAKNKQQ